MHTTFKCNHCGYCCFETGTQINITLGDIQRISRYLNTSISLLFNTYIGILPFAETETKFNLELGLVIPCKFWKKSCTIYQARPLNCRLFPYWILGNAQKSELQKYFHPDNQCLKEFEYDETFRKQYKDYVDKIGNVLLKEADATDYFLIKKKLTTTLDISSAKGYNKMTKKYQGKMLDRKKTEMCIKLIDKKKYAYLPNLIERELNKSFTSISELAEYEKLLL
jgi:uncharacterized protein